MIRVRSSWETRTATGPQDQGTEYRFPFQFTKPSRVTWRVFGKPCK